MSYADYIFGPTDFLTQSRYGVTDIRRRTRDEAAIEARIQSEVASERPRIARSTLHAPGGGEGRTQGVRRHEESPIVARGVSNVAGYEETKGLRKAGSVEHDVTTRCGMRVPHN